MAETLEKPASGGVLKGRIKELEVENLRLQSIITEMETTYVGRGSYDHIKAELDLSKAEIERLKERIAEAERPEATPPQTAPYELAVWQHTEDTKLVKGKGEPCRWRHFEQDAKEWLYHERMNFWADSGYGLFIPERARAMLNNAFNSLTNPGLIYQRLGPEQRTQSGQPTGQPDYSLLPPFHPSNVIEVIVRIRPA
jgi:hypothetical protein